MSHSSIAEHLNAECLVDYFSENTTPFKRENYADEFPGESEMVCRELNTFSNMLISRLQRKGFEADKSTIINLAIVKRLLTRDDLLCTTSLNKIWRNASLNDCWVDEDKFQNEFSHILIADEENTKKDANREIARDTSVAEVN